MYSIDWECVFVHRWFYRRCRSLFSIKNWVEKTRKGTSVHRHRLFPNWRFNALTCNLNVDTHRNETHSRSVDVHCADYLQVDSILFYVYTYFYFDEIHFPRHIANAWIKLCIANIETAFLNCFIENTVKYAHKFTIPRQYR